MPERDTSKQIEHRQAAYRKFEIYIKRGTLLAAVLDYYKSKHKVIRQGNESSGGLSELIRDTLSAFFHIDVNAVFSPPNYQAGQQQLDEIVTSAKTLETPPLLMQEPTSEGVDLSEWDVERLIAAMGEEKAHAVSKFVENRRKRMSDARRKSTTAAQK